MSSTESDSDALDGERCDRVLERLGFRSRPGPGLSGLEAVYGAWCRRVPFDNIRKLIHVRGGHPGPLPGGDPPKFFDAWLRYGAGGTCWANAAALHALLRSLGFDAQLGIATMRVAPDLPPNHGTVLVTLESRRYLVDGSILHGRPLPLDLQDSAVEHPAWGVTCTHRDGHWQVRWRPLHKVDGLDCRLDQFGVSRAEYGWRYEQTRGWSPFNYEVTARRNTEHSVTGVAFGHAVILREDGTVHREPVSLPERTRILIEEVGISEELVRQLPEDVPTPPPPGTRTVEARAAEG